MFPNDVTWVEVLYDLEIVRRGEPVSISNATVEEMSRPASFNNDPARAVLARLWDWPGQGLTFADIYRVFLGHILLSTKSADIAAALRAFSPELTQRNAANGMVNYWWGTAEALEYEELSFGEDFLYYRDRAALQHIG